MHKKAEELQNTALTELEAAREEKLLPPEASSPLARETSLSPPQVNPSEARASASLPSHGPPLQFVTSSPALDATPSSQFDPSTRVMLHFVDEGSNLPSPVYEPPPPLVVSDNEPIVPEIPVTSEVTVSRVPACATVDIDEPPSSPQDQTQVWEYFSSCFFLLQSVY
ncbi:pollen-specific leucine-rich repeat extensin-like protein 1 [Malus sylvestris]|uniref:pollen-specific leucine-rich repeat extensin-like protein 1 n=1 Tax=Malus sylvestris TaxID=3752 RepID=UPI0021AC2567|nr:pollen-specific leucine-rich repeat extensin-like protein 1 [Malus sylvestris]